MRVSKDASSSADSDHPCNTSAIGNGEVAATIGIGANQLWDNTDGYCAWQTNENTCLYEYSPGNQMHNQVVAIIKENHNEMGYMRQLLHSSGDSGTTDTSRKHLMEGKTYRFECHVIVDENHEILGHSQTTDERLEYYKRTYGGRTTPQTNISEHTLTEMNNLDKFALGAEVRITDAYDLANIAGNNEARWLLPHTGKYVWYWTVPSSNKKWNPKDLILWILPDQSRKGEVTSSGGAAFHMYTIIEKISIKEVDNFIPGEFEVNDMNVIYREKTVK